MIIMNYQPIDVSTAMQLVGSSERYQSILQAMSTSQEVFNYPNAELFTFSVHLRAAIIDAAVKLAESDVRFATFYGSKCNPEYWQLSHEGGFLLKPNVQPSHAIRDIFNNSRQYAFECATAMVIILLKGVNRTIGDEAFNRLYRHLYLWDWHEEPHLPLIIEPVEAGGIPGDIIYFKNPQVNPRTPWWQGENAVVLPNGRYYGHGVGIQTAEGIIATLNKFRRPGATRSAFIMDRATRINVAHLYLLLHSRINGWTSERKGTNRRSTTHL